MASSARLSLEEIVELEPETDVNLMIVGSRERGIILHKLMEEVLTGETDDDEAALLARAHDLRAQLIRSDAATAYRDADPAEMAATVRRTLTLPQIAAMRSRMVPEVSVGLSDRGEKIERVTAGVVDTVILRDGSTAEIEAVVDWKSDVHPDASTMRAYREQACDYLRALGLGKGYIVYMTMGKIDEVVALAA